MSSPDKDNSLSKRIETALLKKKDIKTNNTLINNSLVNTFSRVATEILAGLLLGAGLGWTIDNWLDTSPWFLIFFFLIGGAAGILNLWRMITGRGLKIGYFNK
jgi:ATP synthase protein I